MSSPVTCFLPQVILSPLLIHPADLLRPLFSSLSFPIFGPLIVIALFFFILPVIFPPTFIPPSPVISADYCSSTLNFSFFLISSNYFQLIFIPSSLLSLPVISVHPIFLSYHFYLFNIVPPVFYFFTISPG